MSSILEQINNVVTVYNTRKTKLAQDLRAAFPEMFKEVFAMSDKLETISWTQYTPYFNDGDTCTFSVNHYTVEVNGLDEYDADDEIEGFNNDYVNYLMQPDIAYYKKNPVSDEGVDVELCKAIAKARTILQSIPDEFMKDAFGDHCQVTIDKTGEIEVEEYEHD